MGQGSSLSSPAKANRRWRSNCAKTALLAVLWHTLWVDNQAGLDLFTWVLPVLAAADPPTSDAVRHSLSAD